jgi:xanthine dehydrogenase small subunit
LVQFILNEKEISTTLPKGMLLLDFIRYHRRLTGTKIGCREGDCGACTILVGELIDTELVYRSATSCLMAIGNAQGKHIVTVEGTNVEGLNFIQQSFANEGATQCGFCTPGFMVSLAGLSLAAKKVTPQTAIDAVNGNICRCTGYKSIERAVANIADKLAERQQESAIDFAVANNILPAYFSGIKARLASFIKPAGIIKNESLNALKFLGGGTDLYVKEHDSMQEHELDFLYDKAHLSGITREGNNCFLGATTKVTDMLESPVFQQFFPALESYIKLVSSTQIRNMATIAGNIVNASPIGDFTIFFLALNAQLVLSDGKTKREIPLREFYKGYKHVAKTHDEFIEQIYFELPDDNTRFNFEKVSKRTHLDIASVNTAISLQVVNNMIMAAHLSAGGVGPVPTYLIKASAYLIGKQVDDDTISELAAIAQSEITPISDARGTAAYKRFLLGQLIRAHFIEIGLGD